MVRGVPTARTHLCGGASRNQIKGIFWTSNPNPNPNPRLSKRRSNFNTKTKNKNKKSPEHLGAVS